MSRESRSVAKSRRVLTALLVVAGYVLLASVFCRQLFVQPNALGNGDWDQHLFFHAAVLKSVVEYGTPPFWNPWYCGGDVLWQNPQVPLLSPVYLLTAFVPLAAAMKVTIVLHYLVGFLGMHALVTRELNVRFLPAAVYLAVLFTCSGALALHLAVGHSTFLPAFFLPALMFCTLRAVRDGGVRYAVFAGAILALIVVNGGSHVLPLAIVSLGLLLVGVAIATSSWRPFAAAAVIMAVGFALAAPRLVPTLIHAG
jgi:hypothetical protein